MGDDREEVVREWVPTARCWFVYRNRRLSVAEGKVAPMSFYPEDVMPPTVTASAESAPTSYPGKLRRHCRELQELLLAKQEAYSRGSGFTPARTFSRCDTIDRIETRLDDKLSRYQAEGPTRENVDDLLGYLMLLRVEREAEGWKPRPR